jgi:hypothetical protein
MPHPLPPLIPLLPESCTLVQRVALTLAGLLLLGVGLIGWLLPVVPGTPFMVIGLMLAGRASHGVAQQVNRLEAGLPYRCRLLLRLSLRRPNPHQTPEAVSPRFFEH